MNSEKGIMLRFVLAISPLLFGACSVFFDTPSEKPVREEIRERVANEVQSIAQDEADQAKGKVVDTIKEESGKLLDKSRQSSFSLGGKRTGTLSFEKCDKDMPQLIMSGMSGATVLLDGELVPGLYASDAQRIVLIAPGQHDLSVRYASGKPFTASFYIKKGECAFLRGGPVGGKQEK